MTDLSTWTTMLHEHKETMSWIVAISGLVFVGSLILVPWLVIRIPADYFAQPRRPKTRFTDAHPLLRWTGLILKNLLGGLLVISGLAMLLLPGQGLLTLAMGALLLDFPGKHTLEGKIIRMQPVLKSINWLRSKAEVPRLELDSESSRGVEVSSSE